MGGGASSASASSEPATSALAASTIASGAPPTVDATAPTVMVQVRLAGARKRARLTLNATHTIADLYAMLRSEHPTTGDAPFELRAGFPPKAMSDPTLSMATLDGESITQSLL